jgi:hypothetical protein
MCAWLNAEKKEKVENNRLIMGGSKKWEKNRINKPYMFYL